MAAMQRHKTSSPEAHVECDETCIHRMVRAQVGRQALVSLLDQVRNLMYAEALRVSSGNKSVAAKLLAVDRRCVQRMAAQLGLDSDAPGDDATG